ncbi:hypothetical protein HY374_02660 [Candidatus Berkelbacteria bacterium]|nr:hypothetical protein [Candidatus Berkelbacteria bacterium]
MLSVDPTSRGFGFAVLEGPARLVDWGTKDSGRADSQAACREVAALLDRYAPDALVVEEVSDASSRRCDRVRRLIAGLRDEGKRRDISVVAIPKSRVRAAFGGADVSNKHSIAQIISEHFPELVPRLPPRRKAWMSEDARLSIFDAVSFALAHYFEAPEATPPARAK